MLFYVHNQSPNSMWRKLTTIYWQYSLVLSLAISLLHQLDIFPKQFVHSISNF